MEKYVFMKLGFDGVRMRVGVLAGLVYEFKMPLRRRVCCVLIV